MRGFDLDKLKTLMCPKQWAMMTVKVMGKAWVKWTGLELHRPTMAVRY